MDSRRPAVQLATERERELAVQFLSRLRQNGRRGRRRGRDRDMIPAAAGDGAENAARRRGHTHQDSQHTRRTEASSRSGSSRNQSAADGRPRHAGQIVGGIAPQTGWGGVDGGGNVAATLQDIGWQSNVAAALNAAASSGWAPVTKVSPESTVTQPAHYTPSTLPRIVNLSSSSTATSSTYGDIGGKCAVLERPVYAPLGGPMTDAAIADRIISSIHQKQTALRLSQAMKPLTAHLTERLCQYGDWTGPPPGGRPTRSPLASGAIRDICAVILGPLFARDTIETASLRHQRDQTPSARDDHHQCEWQLATLLILRDILHTRGAVYVWRPAVTDMEWNVLQLMNINVINAPLNNNDLGLRVACSTLFWLPSSMEALCASRICTDVVKANWGVYQLGCLNFIATQLRPSSDEWSADTPAVSRELIRHCNQHPLPRMHSRSQTPTADLVFRQRSRDFMSSDWRRSSQPPSVSASQADVVPFAASSSTESQLVASANQRAAECLDRLWTITFPLALTHQLPWSPGTVDIEGTGSGELGGDSTKLLYDEELQPGEDATTPAILTGWGEPSTATVADHEPLGWQEAIPSTALASVNIDSSNPGRHQEPRHSTQSGRGRGNGAGRPRIRRRGNGTRRQSQAHWLNSG